MDELRVGRLGADIRLGSPSVGERLQAAYLEACAESA